MLLLPYRITSSWTVHLLYSLFKELILLSNTNSTFSKHLKYNQFPKTRVIMLKANIWLLWAFCKLKFPLCGDSIRECLSVSQVVSLSGAHPASDTRPMKRLRISSHGDCFDFCSGYLKRKKNCVKRKHNITKWFIWRSHSTTIFQTNQYVLCYLAAYYRVCVFWAAGELKVPVFTVK